MINFKNLLLFLLLYPLSTISVLAHAEKVYNLEGTIGNQEIIMEIRNIEGYYSGRYCFRDKKKSIYLEIEYDSIASRFKMLQPSLETKNQQIFEQIVITEDSLHNWSGEQKTADGNIHKVFLYPIKITHSEPHSIKNEKIKKTLSPYNYCLLSDIKFELTSTQKFKKGIKIEWLTETGSKTKLFRVVDGFSSSKMTEINNYLEQFFINDIINAYSYKNYQNKINISYFTPNIISIVESKKSYTINNNLTTSVMYLTLDLKTLEKLNLEDLLWLGDEKTPRNGSKEYFIYRREVFGKKIKKYVHDSYSKKIDESKCSFSNEKIFQFPDFYLSQKGMVLMLNNYLLSDKCKKQTWIVLGYNDFSSKWNKAYFNKK
ncbi:hypothetical protein [Aestuariibaculum sediminum]|uniref:Uncharacterized protein n=1 Tax=Aestuariibaculum sediminum TaxID=2770637 RepID=A0A8J6QL96_9FLAO|nr:hypothetical protein [Aestuariibaculum sediminum]MBD0833334.1 hypothetical protein [Aestuariibaculum sediminum]